MKKKIKLFLFIVLTVFIIAACSGIELSGYFDGLVDLDLCDTPDGTYSGQAENGPVAVEVNVTVEDQLITIIDLTKHRTLLGKKAEVIPQRIIDEQSLMVDIVSGATTSCVCIIKAVKNAFE